MRITNYTPSYRETNSLGRRQLMTPDEVLRLPPDEELIFIRGQKVLRAKRFDYSKHPHYKKLRNCKAIHHEPDWKKASGQASSIPEQNPIQSQLPSVEPVPESKPSEQKPTSADSVLSSLGLTRTDINDTM